jgi:hypothetical protein
VLDRAVPEGALPDGVRRQVGHGLVLAPVVEQLGQPLVDELARPLAEQVGQLSLDFPPGATRGVPVGVQQLLGHPDQGRVGRLQVQRG